MGRRRHKQVREQLQKLLDPANPDAWSVNQCAIPVSEVTYHLPIQVGDFSDFSCSRDHVLNAGEAVFGVRQLPPGFLHFPIGYGGRSSSILAPESDVIRPLGQFRSNDGVAFGLSRAVDFELEVACVIGKPSSLGQPIDINEADEHIFGFMLLNDWSARDIQGLEMNPLGPFSGKSFGTSISPWIITADALEPYRTAGPKKDLSCVPYLKSASNTSHYSVQLKVDIIADGVSSTVCESQFEWLYWTVNEMIAHQTINGCPLNAGDVLATGTVSGTDAGTHGCLLETTKGGKSPITLKSGAQRTYLEDDDAVRLTGVAKSSRLSDVVGFGQCYGRLRANKLLEKYKQKDKTGNTNGISI